MQDKRKDLIEIYIQRWRNKDFAAVLELLDPNAIYFDMPEQTSVNFDELPDYLSDDMEVESSLHKEISGIKVINEDHAFLTYSLHKAPNSLPVMEGTELLEFRDGKILSITDNYTFFDNEDNQEETKLATMKKLGLTLDDLGGINDNILALISDPNNFTDPGFTLQKLANHSAISRNKLSFVLNQHIGTTFFELLNQQRILWICKSLGSMPSSQSILDIAYEAGFNSSSSFYKAFKKETGLTPKEYLQNQDI
ncbi:helix-turn-helix domain-containing protein [Curvivirga aplysinae]|uniref:helix-turn-helix domain-containing protein n=1 Tax=Curvivirga aplysinae TaxID=2529852 RepID=UPI0012BBFC9D|nr:helix-turn-helix domain-containing protein [Curvivirga aplysinae]MTI09691.1 helix-turn-helix domain-containing protein [Curvivirga aplysinae]